ncbi:MAG: hypothetical protein OEV06_09735 [Anaerolineae bacterium]|nr:hypothetical protein [Anaerolineae bacterium]
MSPSRTPPPSSYYPAAGLLVAVGWGALILLVLFTPPTLGPRWFFYFFLVLALTGLALPAVAYLNYRFPSRPPVGPPVILRQTLWVAVFGSTLAWLNNGRVYSFTLAVILFIGLVAVEFLLRLRERTRYSP